MHRGLIKRYFIYGKICSNESLIGLLFPSHPIKIEDMLTEHNLVVITRDATDPLKKIFESDLLSKLKVQTYIQICAL